MAHDTFDFAFVAKAWTWIHRVGDHVVDGSTRSFPSLSDCIADARKAGFHADAEARRTQSAAVMLPGDGGELAEC